MILAGDIGGTKTILGLFDKEHGPHMPLLEEKFKSDDYPSLKSMVVDFLSRHKAQPELASFGVAGPVHDNRVYVTNLAWEVDGRKLSQALDGSPVYLINDLHSIASAIPTLEEDDLQTLKQGESDEEGPISVIAPGTGLGEAFLFWDGTRYRPIPSEGGHTDFAPATRLELELLAFMQKRFKHVSYERVCSGLGIPNLYQFLRESNRYSEPSWLAEALEQKEEKTPTIVKSAIEGTSELCVAALDLFMAILGSEAGNLVLQVLATGGVYLGGGIPPRILPQLRTGPFLEAFTRKGRFSELLNEVPVLVIVNPKVGLFGAANHGLIMLSEEA
jgi:glucokinase